jgi:nicotinamidase-related amidase
MGYRMDALLIIDMQRDVVGRMVENAGDVVPNIQRVLKRFRKERKPVIHIKRVHRPDGVDVEKFRVPRFEKKRFLVAGSEGAEVIDELAPIEGEYVVEKQRFSAFFQSELPMILRRLAVEKLIVTGVQTPNCIRATVVDAIGYDYDVVVLSDATTTREEKVHEANLYDMKNMGVEVVTTKEYTGE